MLGHPPCSPATPLHGYTGYSSIHKAGPSLSSAVAAGEGRAVEMQRLLIYLLVFHTSISRDVRGSGFAVAR